MVLSVSGSGLKRKAQIEFVQGGGTKSFLVAHSPLEPVPE